MALRQLLLRFWVTDHGDCHFREESLEKVTVVTSKRRENLSKSSKSSNTTLSAFRDGIGRNFKNDPMANDRRHLILN